MCIRDRGSSGSAASATASAQFLLGLCSWGSAGRPALLYLGSAAGLLTRLRARMAWSQSPVSVRAND
eukprot:7755029-Alexandrium_andersonii.AAC.1